MAKFKFSPVTEAAEEAKETGEPVKVKGVGTAGTPRLEPETEQGPELAVAPRRPVQGPKVKDNGVTLDVLHRQLENIHSKLSALEMLVTAQWPKKVEVQEFPKTTNGGHPVTPTGKVAPWKETPSGDQLVLAAQKFVDTYGKKAYRTLLDGFKAKQLADVTGEEQQAALMEKLNGQP